MITKDSERGKGYSTKLVEDGIKWFNEHSEYNKLSWTALSDNTGSRSVAEKAGFEWVRDIGVVDEYGERKRISQYELTKHN